MNSAWSIFWVFWVDLRHPVDNPGKFPAVPDNSDSDEDCPDDSTDDDNNDHDDNNDNNDNNDYEGEPVLPVVVE